MTAKVIGAIWPLIIFPSVLYLTIQGQLDLGGGEKDVVIAIPMLAFTLFYLISYFILIKKKKRTYIAVILSAGIALLLLFVITIVFAQLLGVQA